MAKQDLMSRRQGQQPRRALKKAGKRAAKKAVSARVGREHVTQTRKRWETTTPPEEHVYARSKALVARVYGLGLTGLEKHVARGMPLKRTSKGYDLLPIGDWRAQQGVRLEAGRFDERRRLAAGASPGGGAE